MPQVMTREALELAMKIMRAVDDKALRIGFNSPGALASVNHLHMHMVYVEKDLFVEYVVSYCHQSCLKIDRPIFVAGSHSNR